LAEQDNSKYQILKECESSRFYNEKVAKYSVISGIEVLNQTEEKGLKNCAGSDGGPCCRVCTRLTLCSAPHQNQQTLFGVRFWVGDQKFAQF
jgi:hypothetical protein